MNLKPRPMDIDLASFMTIAIPTWSGGRPKLQKLLKHWAAVGCRLRIVDGSNEPWTPADLYDTLNPRLVEYMHIPVQGGDQWENLRSRFLRGITDIHTPFAALCGDDDVFTRHGLVTATQYLLNDSSLDIVVGRALMVSSDTDGNMMWKHVHAEWQDSDIWRSRNPLDRVVKGDGMGLYGIGRSEFLDKLWRYVFGSPHTLPYLEEYLIKFLTQLVANVRVIDSLLWIRGPESSWFDPRGGNHLQMMERLVTSPDDHNLVTTRLAAGIQLLLQDTTEEEALAAALVLLELHESEVISHERRLSVNRVAELHHRVIIRLFPTWLRYELYRLLDKRNSGRKQNPLVYSALLNHELPKVFENFHRAAVDFEENEIRRLDPMYRSICTANSR